MTVAPADVYKLIKAHVDDKGTDYLGKLSRDIAALFPSWQPMDTAPLDGTHCILAVQEGAFIWSVEGVYRDGEWDCVYRSNVKPLAWMPNVLLPDWATPWTQESSA